MRSKKAVQTIARVVDLYNRFALKLSMLAMVFTSCILTYSVIVRYFFNHPTDWQDETSAIILFSTIFLCAAGVQSTRGHIGIQALSEVLPEKVDTWRILLVDIASFIFVFIFSWKTWQRLHEVISEGETTSSILATPLWVPISMMAIGMTFLTLQILLQIVVDCFGEKEV